MKKKARFEIEFTYNVFEMRRYYFRIRSSNGRTLAHSETYNSLASTMRACRIINPKMRIVVK